MNTQSANAYYSPLNDEIVLPAAILRSRFFDLRADRAEVRRAIGFVSTNQITHGIDTFRLQVREHGNLANWWTEVDRERFGELNTGLASWCYAIWVLPNPFVEVRAPQPLRKHPRVL